MKYIPLKRPATRLETALCEKAEEIVCDKPHEVYDNILHLFVALSIFKLTLPVYSFEPDLVQINLFKDGGRQGIRIYRIGQHDIARIIE